jgi:phage shock protein C
MYNYKDIMEKKFFLSKTDKKIAGVCGGLAEYFSVDAMIIRVIFVVLALGGSLGFWLYILLWLFAPNRNEA